ncbi:methyltransferase [Vibrio ponticus]|uniref:Methyltransferase n=1 Tax=Vibrio ponticus TaxID=265668 RepID=A0ABX3FP65_9VIBR|nr:class I SAM-dependent methyltransferase [Vibrio ponticus]OLQ94577.1 methyltransferase [Vibrio ponticus]
MSASFKANYDAIASQWLAVRTHLASIDQAMFERFVALLPSEAKLLDLGCGSGEPISKLLSKYGFNITGVDRSHKLLKHAQSILPQHQWLQAELEEFKPSEHYHGVVIWDSMFHLPREQHLSLLKKAYHCLNSGGAAIISSGGSEKSIPAFVDTMFEQPFYYDAFPIEELLQHCQNIGFEIVHYELVNKPDGKRDKGRLGVILHKPL